MASAAMHLSVVTPTGSEVELPKEATVEEVVLPGKLGELGILPGHIPFATALKAGRLRWKHGGNWRELSIGDGFAEVSGTKIIVLTRSAQSR
jgi:F-type H+-transporting ATPase subunit epsilon